MVLRHKGERRGAMPLADQGDKTADMGRRERAPVDEKPSTSWLRGRYVPPRSYVNVAA